MMFRKLALVLGMSLTLTACAGPDQTTPNYWNYGSGTNIDIVCTTNVTFFKNGKVVFSYPGGGCNAGALHQDITEKKYYWTGGGGLPVRGIPVPDKALIEMVSFHDRKRYRISTELPADLTKKMQQRYQIGERKEQRNWLYFGLAPGGYYEVLLFGNVKGASPDILLKRGQAEEVQDNWYDKKYPIGTSQYTVLIKDFDNEYAELFKQHPIPKGMEWAPIMDAYRVKQPKTDQHPVD